MSAGTVFTSSLGNTLKDTLEAVVDDDTDGVASNLTMSKFCDEMSMTD